MTTSGQKPEVARRSTCRVCDETRLDLILSLGPTPLANAFLTSPDQFPAERRYPLDLYFCRACGLLQLLDIVSPEVLFRHYLYVSGTSTTMAAHHREYTRTLCDVLDLGPTDLVVEVASNDGSLLRCFHALGVGTLGIEPARNLAEVAEAAGIKTVPEFFSRAIAQQLRATGCHARAVLANNVLAHVDDPVDFLEGCRDLVDESGLIVIEVPYVGDLLDRLEYDTVYHEHLSYFSIGSLLYLARRAGLSAVRLDRLGVHGGSLRLYLSPRSDRHAPEVLALSDAERDAGLGGPARYVRFADDVREARVSLVALLERLAAEGRRVVGYGAPAKGNTLLNVCGIDTRLVAYTVDRNPLKVGLFTPGAHLPVRDVGVLMEAPSPDYILLLAWNLADEIRKQLHWYRDRGGLFILPVPVPHVIRRENENARVDVT